MKATRFLKLGLIVLLSSLIFSPVLTFGQVVVMEGDSELSVVEDEIDFHGWEDDNYVAEGMGEAVIARGLQKGLEKNYLSYQGIMLDFLKQTLTELPNGSEGQREAAFKIQNYLLISALISVPTAPLAGGLIGGAVGGALGIGAYGAGSIPAAAAGTAIGTGTGTVASAGYFGIVAAVMVMNLNEINDKYPPSGVATRGGSDSEELGFDEIDDEWEDQDEVMERGRKRTRQPARRKTQRARRARTAGPQESLFVHLIATSFGDRIHDLARFWDRAPGLSARQKAQLRQVPFLRSAFQSLSFIRSNKRAGRNALPAMPLSAWQRTVTKLLVGDQQAVQDLWLSALAAGETRLRVRNGKVTWQTPGALRQLGAQSSYTATLSKPYVKVGGNGAMTSPYLKVRVTPGPFDINLGKARIEGSRVKLSYTVRANSRIGAASMRYKMGGREMTTSSFVPRLKRNLTGNLYFKFVGPVLVLDQISVGSGSFRLATPSFSGLLAPLNNIVGQLTTPLRNKLSTLLGSGLKFGAVLGNVGAQSTQRLLAVLNAGADEFGLSSISALRSIRVVGNKLQLQVVGQALAGVPQLQNVQQFMRKVNSFINKNSAKGRVVPASARRRK